MADDVVLNKAAVIERCVSRVREEYAAAGVNFATNFTHQDAAVLNIQRACEACVDVGHHLVRRDRLGLPQSARDVFDLLAAAHWIDPSLAESLKKMIGFRNIAVHEYQRLLLPITENVITAHLDEFLAYASALIRRDAAQQGPTPSA